MASGNDVSNQNSSNLSAILHKGLTELWLDEVCTDFEIETDTKTFRCHKVVLAAVSDYFRAMFNSGMSENASNKAKFDDISAATFDTLFQFLYPQKQVKNVFENKTDEDIIELLKVASRLQMQFLEDICIDFFIKTISVSNCVERWKAGQLILCDVVTEMAWKCILQTFAELVKESIFVTLEIEDLIAILGDLDLNVEKETLVWSAIKKWIDFDKDAREKHFMALFKTCCLSEIESDFLVEKIAFDPLVRRNDDASSLVQEVLSFSKHLGNHGYVELTFRNCYEKQQSLVVLCDGECPKAEGDLNSHEIKRCVTEDVDVSVYSIDVWTQNAKPLRPLQGVGSGLACCVHGYDLYVVGGRRGTLTRFSGQSQTWKTLDNLPAPLQGHTMSATDACLFVLGGKSKFHANHNVLAYSFDTGKWTAEGELMAPVFGASSVAVNGIIYIVGGELKHQPTDCIQTYDPREKMGTILCSLPSPCKFSRSVCRGAFLYIVSSEGEVVRVCTETAKCETIASIPHFDRTNFGIDLRGGKLSIFGGQATVVVQKTGPEKGNRGKVKFDTTERDLEEEEDENSDDAHHQEVPSFENQLVTDVVVVDIKTGEITDGEPLETGMEVLGCGLLVHEWKTVKPNKCVPYKPLARKR